MPFNRLAAFTGLAPSCWRFPAEPAPILADKAASRPKYGNRRFMMNIFKGLYAIGLCLTLAGPGWCDDFAIQVREPVAKAVEIRQETQDSLDKWSGEKARLAARFKTLESQNARLVTLRNEKQRQNDTIREHITTLEQQKTDIQAVSRGLMPVLAETAAALERSVEYSLPFLDEERIQRMESLKITLEDQEAPLGEKYRRVTEALLVEAQYGGTTEITRQAILIQNEERLVDVLRLGRMAMFFRTLDQEICGAWDPATAGFKVLPAASNTAINQAMDMAAKRMPADILLLPVGEVAVQ